MATSALTDYAFEVKMNTPYETALEQVKAALKAEGFGVLTSIDVKSTMREKLDVEFRKYAILGACNPPLAHRALTQELAIGLLLPCNVVVYEEGDGTVVSIVDPIAMMQIAESPALEPVAQEAHTRLLRVADALRA